jgi:hypothetical protein
MYSKEPFEFPNPDQHSSAFLNMDTHVMKGMNDRNYKRLLIEILLGYRKKANDKINRPHRSFPVGSLILAKDFSKSPAKKLKPIFQKTPEIVISEYHSTVYAEDLFHKVRKHSKNNIKLLSLRSGELFANLPDNLKIILGEEINPELWETLKNSDILPVYLEQINTSTNMDRLMRGHVLPCDTHLLEQDAAELVQGGGGDEKEDQLEAEIDNFFIDTLESDLVEKLNVLHTNEQLTNPDLSFTQIPNEYENFKNGVGTTLPPLDDMDEENYIPPLTANHNLADLHIDNILPAGTRRRVRFE